MSRVRCVNVNVTIFLIVFVNFHYGERDETRGYLSVM